ncbi:Heat shock protein IV [Amphibalanus amphitrite]|uniref:Heat shock protein IV n=1 Tax=Amphibalanus amphitrite TaxID=1232801 RepID=A0A6A4W6R3_AMPAM|nr:Heat shock protein IV [Amphibalanus amphitrite]
MPKSVAPAIGIDLGTTYSCVGVFQNGKVEIIANDQGSRTTPSYVAFSETEWFAGEVAKSQSLRNPKNTVFDAKRMLGRGFDDEELRRDMKRWPFKVIDDRGIPKIEVQYKNKTKLFTPVEISSMMLTKMKMTAEAYLGKTVAKAVITVPAYFTNAQRQATKDAGKIAGLDVMRIINEPTAAVLAYGLDKKLDEEQKVLIFDLGGGTFDVSVLAYADQVFQVMATAGDTHLGGEDFDHRLVEHFANEFKRQHKKDPRTSSLAMRRLKVACEEAKRTLSSTSVAHVNVDSLLEGIDFAGKVSRARFDELCGDLFRKTLDTVQSALDDANLKRTDIDEVILVGGSTRIPKVRKLLQDFFDGKKLNLRINADEAVAFGATVQAATLSGQEVPGVDLLIDVIPYSLGVREGENNFAKFIERNSHVPIRVEKEFVLGRDYQTAAQVDIYEGEHPNARNNHLLGEFLLDGLPAMKRGETKLKIVYDVDADGIMTVSAKDTMSGKSKEIQVNCMSYIGPEELKKMQENAARMAAEAKAEEERRRGEDEEEQFTTSWEGDGRS